MQQGYFFNLSAFKKQSPESEPSQFAVSGRVSIPSGGASVREHKQIRKPMSAGLSAATGPNGIGGPAGVQNRQQKKAGIFFKTPACFCPVDFRFVYLCSFAITLSVAFFSSSSGQHSVMRM